VAIFTVTHMGGDFHGDAARRLMHAGVLADHWTPLATASDWQHPDSSWLFGDLFRSLAAAAAFSALPDIHLEFWLCPVHIPHRGNDVRSISDV
jgi:hypothetical protein